MKRTIQRLLATGIVAVALAAAPVARRARATERAERHRGPDGNNVFLVAHAVGVQIYACNTTVSGPKWGLVAPERISTRTRKLIGTHFGGPTWRTKDGSEVKARREADVTPDLTAIPWLRLAATSKTAGQDGDRLGATTFIQRVATTGGLEPAAETCTATTVGMTEEVGYTADYVFWKAP